MDMAPHPLLQCPAQLESQWEALAREAAEPNCFYAPSMLQPALRHLAPTQDVRMLEAWQDGDLIGLLPVSIAPRHGRYPVRCVTNWVHRHCFFGAPLVRKGAERAAWDQFLAALDSAPWASGFLHLTLLDAKGANAAALADVCRRERRPFREVHRHERAMLRSNLSADAYWEANMRGKKRKEIRRLQKRLAETGAVESRILQHREELGVWCQDFLQLEQSGWKGAEGTALACTPADAAFFHECMCAAFASGELDFLRIDFEGRAMAMLVNIRHGEGSFSFKIAFDETLARFSPGVLIELENLRQVLDAPGGPRWMDSCAAPGHPMIDSLWGERRTLAQYRVALKGRSRLAWLAVETGDMILKRLKKGKSRA